MALMTWKHDGTVRRTGSTSTSWGYFELDWSGLPENIRIKRVYWQWDVSRQKGSVYARWYYGTSGNTLNGNTGVNGEAFQFDVTSKVTISGTSGTAWVYLGAQYGWADYSNISFNIEFDYLQSSFTLSTTNVDAGKTITANIDIQDSTATHKATWQFGTQKQPVTTGAGVDTSSFTIPLAWLDQIPNATSGLASCTLETINSAGTVVGSQVLYFNILAPTSVVPSVSAFTATRVNNSVPSAWGVYVQGQSGVTIKATAAGAYGSTITGYTLTGDGKTANAATLSVAKLSGSGTLTFKATVVDSRGRSASKTLTISVAAWSSPTIKTLSVGRCNADGSANPAGSSILVSLTGAISSVSSKNTATVTVKYRAQGATTWLSGATGTVASGSWVIAADAALPTNAYEVQAVLTDAFTSATQTTVLPTAECFLDQMPGRKRLGIGGYNATDKSLYINPEWGIHWGEKHITDSPRNLLVNSDFANPINMQGKTSYGGTADAPAIDRWVLPNAKVSASIGTGCIDVTNADATNRTIMQHTTALAGYDGPVTAAVCLADGTVLCGSCINDSADTSGRQSLWEVGSGTVGAALYGYEGYKGLGIIVKNGKTVKLRWAALYKGAYTADTLPEYVVPDKRLEMIRCGVPVQPRDRLDNSDFTNPVNQRGQTSYTTVAYCIDRWMLGKGKAELAAAGIKLTGATFRQPVVLPAGTYTFAVHLSNGTTLDRKFQYDGVSTITDRGGASTITDAYVNMYNYKSGVVMVQFVQTDSSAVVHTLVWAALYEGAYTADTLPEYASKGYAAELAECQRYYKANPLKVIQDTTISETGIAKINLTGLNLEYVQIMLSCTAFTAASGIHIYPYSGGKVAPANLTTTAGSAYYAQMVLDRRNGAAIVNNCAYTSATSMRTLSGAGYNYINNILAADPPIIERVLVEVHSGDLQFPVGSRILIMGIEGVKDL